MLVQVSIRPAHHPLEKRAESEGAQRRMNFARDADVSVGFKTNRRPPSAERVARVTD
jgi:hypothetical protein